MEIFAKGPVLAFGRNAVSYTAGAITAAAALHLLTPEQTKDLTTALGQIVNGFTTLAGGVATFVAFGSSLYAAFSATRTNRLNALAADPEIRQVTVRSPEVADAIPSNKVIAQ